MSRLIEHIEEVRRRLTEIATSELALVRALGDALSRADEKLLHDVRSVTVAHEARRSEILCELQVLATRIGAFPAPQEPMAAIGTEAETPAIEDTNGHHTLGPGDWRQAAKNIEDDLDFLEWEIDRSVRTAVNGHHYNGDIRLDHA